MNIFVLDYDISKAALYHNCKHIVKMPLESAQMICTVLNDRGVKTPYRSVHRKHPCTIWAGKSKSNFVWLGELGLALCKEYSYRYNKVHACEAVITYCLDNCNFVEEGNLTEFALAMPENYKSSCAVESYRNYYRNDKAHLANWGIRNKPEWY